MNPIESPGGFSSSFESSRSRSHERGSSGLGHTVSEQLQMEQDVSMLADAAEEMSLFHAETAESKHVAERRKEMARPRALMSAQAIESYIEDTEEDEDGEEKLRGFVSRVMGGRGDPGLLAREAFTKPTAQYLALQYALQQGAREGASEQLTESFNDALDDLEMEHGPRIRADINTVGAAREGAAGPSEVVRFQSTYVDLVMGQSKLADTLKLVLDEFGETGLEAGLARLQGALGQDLAAARPSTEVNRLQSLVQDLYQLGVATTVLDGCKELLADLEKRHSIRALGEAVPLMKALVDLSSESWISNNRFIDLAEKAGAFDGPPRINFLTGVKGLVRDMPTQIFVDTDQRLNVLSAAQGALDMAIDSEEM